MTDSISIAVVSENKNEVKNVPCFEWQNISYSVSVPGEKRGQKETKQLLHEVSGSVAAGQVTDRL
jgi:hypothetical protein